MTLINHYAVFFDRKITYFYSWIILKDNSVLVGGAFLENEKPRLKYDMLIRAVKNKEYEIGGLIKISACYLLRPRLKDIKLGKCSTALIGEAVGFISPSSSEGLSYAIEVPKPWRRHWIKTILVGNVDTGVTQIN